MEEIVKISENNIEVRTYRIAELGEKIYIGEVKVYGQSRMQDELKAVEDKIAELTSLDVAKSKADSLKDLESKRSQLLEVKSLLETNEFNKAEDMI